MNFKKTDCKDSTIPGMLIEINERIIMKEMSFSISQRMFMKAERKRFIRIVVGSMP